MVKRKKMSLIREKSLRTKDTIIEQARGETLRMSDRKRSWRVVSYALSRAAVVDRCSAAPSMAFDGGTARALYI